MTPTEELTNLITLGEGPTTEFKQSGADKSLGEEICAFANAAGGTVLVGVTDTGEIVGVSNHNKLKSQIQSVVRSAEPSIVVKVESINDVLRVTIPEQYEKPYSFRGKFFVRSGASSQRMSRDEIREFFFRERQIHFDKTYCPDYNLRDDLTEEIWSRFTERANIPKNVNKAITLHNLHLVKEGRMTYAGAWLLCNDITFYTLSARVTCVMFRGTTNAHILDRRDFTGDLYSIYEDCMAYMQSKLNTALIPHARGRDERLELPEDALREALANAIAHRDYRSTANVHVRIYHDRLEIVTPGGLPAGMREEDLGYKSVPRNPLLFDLLLRMHLVEKIGSGIQRIRDLCREYGVGEPEFDISEEWVTVIFPRNLVEVTQPINGLGYKDQPNARLPLLEGAQDTLAWFEKALQLWRLRHRNYIFDDAFDGVCRCWFGQEKNTGTLTVLACYQTEAEAREAMPRVTDYVQKLIQATREQSHGQLHEQLSWFRDCPPESREADGGGQRIEFILALQQGDVDRVETVDGINYRYISESRLLDGLVDFSDYFQDIRYRVERETLPDSELTLKDTYTPSRYRLDEKDAEGDDDDKSGGAAEDLEPFLHHWLAENGLRQLALLGEYGQGKSTASLLLSYQLIQQYREDRTTRIPVLLELRGKSPRSLTPEDLLATWAHRYRIDTQALLQLIIAGRVLLILEGFDEIDLTGDTETRLSHFRRLWQLSYPKAKILITGRPNFFLDDAERKSALGIQRPSGDRPYCQAIHLLPFDTDRIERSLRAADAGVRAGIVALAEGDQRFREIVSRPSLLHIVSTLWRRENLGKYHDRISSALVMDLFLQHSYRRQGAKQGERAFMALNTAERAYFMAGIAAYMGARRLPNQISKQQLDEAIRALIRAIPDGVSQSVTTIQNEANAPLRSQARFDWKNREPEIIEHIKTDARACGLLVSDLSKDGHFKFAHKSFLEFLEARVLSQLFAAEEPERISGASLANTWKLEIDDLKDSPEAMTFLAELLAQKFRERGQREDHEIARGLLAALVWGNLPGKRSWKSVFWRLSVRPALWLAGRLVGIFGVRRRKYIVFGLFVAVVGAVAGAFALVTKYDLAGMMAFPITLSAVGIGLLLGYWVGLCTDFLKRQKTPIWRRLHLWYQSCKNLHLSLPAMARTVGAGVVELLEDGGSEEKDRREA